MESFHGPDRQKHQNRQPFRPLQIALAARALLDGYIGGMRDRLPEGRQGGSWIARLRGDDGNQHYDALGAADDARDADGLTCFTFAQAQERARTFFGRKARELAGHSEPQAGPYTVEAAIGHYLEARERRGSKGVRADRYAAAARIILTLARSSFLS